MKTPVLAMFLVLGSAAWADGPPALPAAYGAQAQATVQPSAYATAVPAARPAAQAYAQPLARPYAQTTLQPTTQGAGGPYRYAASPLTRSAYAGYGTRPVARPTPTPVQGPILHVGDFSPYWSAGLRVGAGLPLGDMTKYNNVGFGSQADVLYQVAPNTALDLFAIFTDMPSAGLPEPTHAVYYIGTAEPTTVVALGLKGLWQFYGTDDARFFVDAGLGFVSLNRTHETAATDVPGLGDTTWTAGSGSAINGLLLTAGLGVSYQLLSNLNLLGEVDFNDVDLSGGTGDMPQFAQPMVGLSYDFK
jgi:hypothetical protein